MGMANAPATFQRAMNSMLGHLTRGPDACVLVYLDDLLVYSRSEEEHAAHLRLVFAALQQHKILLHPEKCSFGVREVVFLGHTISPNRVGVEAEKVAALANWAMPRTRVDIQRFVGFCNFYRAFIQDFAEIAEPLTTLLQGEHAGPATRLEIEPSHRTAFHALKQRLMSAPVLAIPNPSVGFSVSCDASDKCVGAVLEQEGHPIAFFSKKLNAAELNYPVREKELLAQVTALEHWRVYLAGGQAVTVYTDHHSLVDFSAQELRSGRLARWAERLEDFHIRVVYRRGELNVADALSRATPMEVDGEPEVREPESRTSARASGRCATSPT
jgi:hypothetical protein